MFFHGPMKGMGLWFSLGLYLTHCSTLWITLYSPTFADPAHAHHMITWSSQSCMPHGYQMNIILNLMKILYKLNNSIVKKAYCKFIQKWEKPSFQCDMPDCTHLVTTLVTCTLREHAFLIGITCRGGINYDWGRDVWTHFKSKMRPIFNTRATNFKTNFTENNWHYFPKLLSF